MANVTARLSDERKGLTTPRATTPDAIVEVPLTRPSVPDPVTMAPYLDKILSSGVLTNGPFVHEFERAAADYLGIGHCVAVASCTAGLMLVLRAAGLSGDVVLPSFTFMATAHSVAWNGLRPVFADVDPDTLTLSPEAVGRAIGVRTSAILATHVYGTPCAIGDLTDLARSHGIRLFFDAAHAFGSNHFGAPVGRFGDAEVFSLSPTKVLVAGEGGLIATDDDLLADRLRIGRDYGNPGDYDCQYVGLNARMSEFHAAMALASLERLNERVQQRNTLASLYREQLGDVPGLRFPRVRDGDRSTYKDFTILVDPDEFGIDANGLSSALAAAGIETRRYYSPPVHQMRAYLGSSVVNGPLPVTEAAARCALTLPMWSEMSPRTVGRVAEALKRTREQMTR